MSKSEMRQKGTSPDVESGTEKGMAFGMTSNMKESAVCTHNIENCISGMKLNIKKAAAVLLILAMTFCMAACGDKTPSGTEPGVNENALYEAFMECREPVYGDVYADEICTLEGFNPLADEECLDIAGMVQKILIEGVDGEKGDLSGLNYAYIDLGNDGSSELAIEIKTVDRYGTEYFRQAIIKEVDGRLQLCRVLTTNFRTYEKLSGVNGLITNGGSNGVVISYFGNAVLDADGHYHDLFLEEDEFSMGALFPEINAITEAASKYEGEIPYEYCLRTLYFYDGENDIHGEDSETEAVNAVYGADPEDDELVHKIFEESGETMTSKADIQSRIDKILESYGVGGKQEDPQWIELDADKAGLGDVAKYGVNPVFVSTMDELTAAVDDNTTIVLSEGTYNVTEWLRENMDNIDFYYFDDQAQKGIVYMGDADEPGFVIRGYSGLTIAAAEGENVEIVSEPRYHNVITFANCDNTKLQGLTAGHTGEPGVCSGDVIGLVDSYNADIVKCDLYGCGAHGVHIDMTQGVNVTDTVIRDCSYGCAVVYSSFASFNNCTFRDCKEYTMFDIVDSNTYFNDCTFDNLQGEMLYMTKDAYAMFNRCSFDENSLDGIQNYQGEGNVSIEE